MNRQVGGDAISGSGFVGKGREAGAEDSGNHWGWVGADGEEAWSRPLPLQWGLGFSLLFLGIAPPPAPGHPSLARASGTREPSLPTTPTVLESGEQWPLLAKQLLKQTVCCRAVFSEADFVVGVGRCVYR